jgi:hypothetical protein
VPALQPFIYAQSLFDERKIIFAWKLRISVFCEFAQAFPVFITMGLGKTIQRQQP